VLYLIEVTASFATGEFSLRIFVQDEFDFLAVAFGFIEAHKTRIPFQCDPVQNQGDFFHFVKRRLVLLDVRRASAHGEVHPPLRPQCLAYDD
jgi:hypothetical protein